MLNSDCTHKCKRYENLIGEMLELYHKRQAFGPLDCIDFGPAYEQALKLEDALQAKIEEIKIVYEANRA